MKIIDVEDLVRWAYREELPKAQPIAPVMPSGFGFAWGGVAQYGALLASVDEPDVRNRFGVVPDLTAQVAPKEDAVRVWSAVRELDQMDLALPEDWNPLEDLGDLGPLGIAAVVKGARKLFAAPADLEREAILRGSRRARVIERAETPAVFAKPVSDIIVSGAIMGPQDWSADRPVLKKVAHQNGQPKWFRRMLVTTERGSMETEVDGFDHKRRRPYPDAYVKKYLDPDPVDAVVRRGEYQLWHAGLCLVAEWLSGRLDEFDVRPPAKSAEPWLDQPRKPVRILRDMRRVQPIVKVHRPVAGKPWTAEEAAARRRHAAE